MNSDSSKARAHRAEEILSSRGVADLIADEISRRGLVDEPGLERAQRAHHQGNDRFEVVLTRLGLVPEDVLTRVLAEMRSLPLLEDISQFPAIPILAEQIAPDFARNAQIIPIAETGDEVVVATPNAFNDEACGAIAYLLGKRVTRWLVPLSVFERVFDTLYSSATDAGDTDHPEHQETAEGDVERLRDIASHAPIIQLVNKLIAEAVELAASDIHIEPQIDHVRVRFRLDGELRTVHRLPAAQRAAIASRIKIMARLNIAERRLPQDGRLRTSLKGTDVDFRVSAIPTQFGESLVLRILDRNASALDLYALGLQPKLVQDLAGILQAPNGLMLVTGPTGSGKTTTLYASLKTLNSDGRKIITVEDPVEYQLEGINQIQVQPKIGLDFAAALRSILRQDPDIILVGEIRDAETAQIAIQASLTGHLVLATLHTNSAAAAVTRLLEMGVEHYLLASCLRGILAQRLVRKLCSSCSVADDLANQALTTAGVPSPRARKGVGCAACRNAGFSGRTTIAELLMVDEAIRKLIAGGGGEEAVEAAATRAGMSSLYADGLRKAATGETTLDEVSRIARAGGEA